MCLFPFFRRAALAAVLATAFLARPLGAETLRVYTASQPELLTLYKKAFEARQSQKPCRAQRQGSDCNPLFHAHCTSFFFRSPFASATTYSKPSITFGSAPTAIKIK